jgi:hypothetical protein
MSLRLSSHSGSPVVGGGKFEGCVEEVDFGKSQRFASVEEFLSFLQRCLSIGGKSPMRLSRIEREALGRIVAFSYSWKP